MGSETSGCDSDGKSEASDPVRQWEEFRHRLEEARDGLDGGSYSRDEIQQAMREANLVGVSPYLVLACDRACESHKKFAHAVVSGSRQVKKLLTIDDEPGLTKLLKASLESSGKFEVLGENDPRHALDRMRQFGPDLVLLDLIMPEIDGRAILRQIAADEELCTIPVVVVSSLVAGVDDGEGGMTKDGVLYLSKPVQLRNLVHCIERLLYSSAKWRFEEMGDE